MPINRSQKESLIALLLFVVLAVPLLAWFEHGRPQRALTNRERLEYGDYRPYAGAPFCCIYVGLGTNEANSFEPTFKRFSSKYGVLKVTKHYMGYSGPGVANYLSDHAAFHVFPAPTSYIARRQENFADTDVLEQSKEYGDWGFAREHGFWSTNASRIHDRGQDIRAPFTGCILFISYDPQYSTNDFKILADSITAEVRTNWPGRFVESYLWLTNQE